MALAADSCSLMVAGGGDFKNPAGTEPGGKISVCEEQKIKLASPAHGLLGFVRTANQQPEARLTCESSGASAPGYEPRQARWVNILEVG